MTGALRVWMGGSVLLLQATAIGLLVVVAGGLVQTGLTIDRGAILGTLGYTLAAMAIAGPLGASVGIWQALREERGWSRLLKRCVQGLHRIPTVTVGVAGAVWLDQFDRLSLPVVIVSTLVAIVLPDMAVGVERGLRQVSLDVRDHARLLGASSLQVMAWILLPAARMRIVAATLRAAARVVAQLTPILVLVGWPGRDLDGTTLTVRVFSQLADPWQAMPSVVVLLVLSWGLRLMALRVLTEAERQ